MATTAEIQASIAEIEAKLAAGVSSVNRNGRHTAYDLEQLRAERERLSRKLAAQSGSQFRRVTFKNA